MLNSGLGVQCIPTTALSLFPGFLDVALSGAAFSSHGLAPLESEMEASERSLTM